MAVATSSPPPRTASSSRPSRQTIEEELYLLRSRTFVKSESRRLNSQSPRYSRTNKEEFRNGPTRRCWRRRTVVRRGDDNPNYFVERMRDAARKARVFQLRISGGRSWWPPSMMQQQVPTTVARIDAEVMSYLPPNRCEERVLTKLTFNDRQDRRAKNSEGPKIRHSNNEKQKFEWNLLWKNKNRRHDQSETATVIDECLDDVDTLINTTTLDDQGTDSQEIIAEAENFEKERRNKQNRQNVVVAAVATTSVSSLGVALAIILL